MNAKLSNRFPTRMVTCLVALLLAVVVMVTDGASRNVGPNPSFAAAQELASPASDGPLVWVRQDAPVINVNNDPLRYESPDPRFAGSFTQYAVAEGAISKQERFVDHEIEFYNVTIDTQFDRPPLVITPPLRYKMNGSYAHGGTYKGGGMVGAKLNYYSDWATIEPAVIQGYFPWEPWYAGNATTEWMISALTPSQPGQSMKVTAGWIDCPPCNVTWTYKAEPAYEVEQLGVEVVAPVIKYQGEEFATGATFSPDTCATPDGKATDCGYRIYLSDSAVAYMKCISHFGQILAIVERSQISELKMELVMYITEIKLMQQCGPPPRSEDDYELGLVLEQGAFLLEGVMANQSVIVHTSLGTAKATARGTFLAGYHPDNKVATFKAYSAPLTIQPKIGAAIVLQSGRQVKLTAAGFGPVTPLQQVYLPATIR